METEKEALLKEAKNRVIEESLSLDNMIVKFIEEGIVAKGYHLLSKLGQELGNTNLDQIRNTTGKKLTEYVQEKFSDQFEILPLQSLGRNILGVVNRGTHVKDIEINKELDNQQETRFNRHFWAAFSVPLKSKSHVRFLNMNNFFFEDRDQDVDRADNEEIIEADLVPETNVEDRDEFIKKSINSWLRTTNVSRSTVSSQSIRQKDNQSLGAMLNPVSVLDLLLLNLDKSQLQRVSLPLDIIATLNSKRVSS